MQDLESIIHASHALGIKTVLQLETLAVIHRHRGEATPKTIGDSLATTTANVTQIIDRLDDIGLIKRTRSVCDRRSYLLSLTPRALTLFPNPAP